MTSSAFTHHQQVPVPTRPFSKAEQQRRRPCEQQRMRVSNFGTGEARSRLVKRGPLSRAAYDASSLHAHHQQASARIHAFGMPFLVAAVLLAGLPIIMGAL